MHTPDRRGFLAATAGLALTGLALADDTKKKPLFDISLAEWSLHRALGAKKLTNLDFPVVAKKDYGISAVEYVNQFFKDKAKDTKYLAELKKRCDDNGVRSVLIMCDGEGMMGHSDQKERLAAADSHRKWVDIAAELGCSAIRTNMYPEKQPATPEEIDAFLKYCAESFTKLCEYAKGAKINVLGLTFKEDVPDLRQPVFAAIHIRHRTLPLHRRLTQLVARHFRKAG